CRQVCCLLLTQSGHLVLGLLPRKNDDWTPLSNSRACVRALLYRPRPMAARFRHARNDVELWPEDDVALAPRDDLVIWDASDPSSSCHKWRPYLVSPYMQSGNGAIAELSWVPALCHRRQQSTEQTHVTMVFAAAGCRFRANLELRRQLYARGDRRRSACDAGLRQAAGDQRLSQRPAACRLLRGGDRRPPRPGLRSPPPTF